MIDEKDIHILYNQMQSILENVPYEVDTLVEDRALYTLHAAINKLAKDSKACNKFLNLLAHGQLEVTPPDRTNALASSLKELQANLRHLTWQAHQVAKGDYGQQINFLGDFSTAFNEMTRQLQERESKLRQKNEALRESKTLLCAVMDEIREWLIVIDEESGNIIYIKEAAKKEGEDNQKCIQCNGENCHILRHLASYTKEEGRKVCEIKCCQEKRMMQVKSFYIEWEERGAYAHLITDITEKKLREKRLETFAYVDDLTGVYNRRYCMQLLEAMTKQDTTFTIGFIDIDRLKYVNDTFGHHIGDEYIRKVAAALKCIMKSGDVLARIGGDEFIIILYHDKVEEIGQRLEELCKEIESAKEVYAMSISYGIRHIENPQNIDTKEVLKKVDEAMYAHKKAKRG